MRAHVPPSRAQAVVAASKPSRQQGPPYGRGSTEYEDDDDDEDEPSSSENSVKRSRGRGAKQAGVRKAFEEHCERLRGLLMLEFDEEKKLSEERLLAWREQILFRRS